MKIDRVKNIKVSEEVLSQELRGETVLLDLSSEQYFGLDQVGTRIWQLIKEGRDIDDTFKVILAEYEVDQEKLEADMEMFLTSLTEAGLIEVEPADFTSQ